MNTNSSMEKIGGGGVSSLPPEPVQDPDQDQDKDAYIDSLVSENESMLRSIKALHAEKEALMLRLQRQTGVEGGGGNPPSPHPKPDVHVGWIGLAGTSSTEESVATYADYLEAQQKLKSRTWRRNSSTMTHGMNATNTTVRGARELEIIRGIGSRRGGAEWDQYCEDDVDGEDGENVGKEKHQHSKSFPWYFPPVQRQRWGEDHSLPHVNWGDLFFDLFYVGAAHNLGKLLLYTAANDQDELLRRFIYFFGSLGPLWTCWEVQTLYEGRYLTHDCFHRLIEIFRYLCVGMAIFIIPWELHAHPRLDNVMVFFLAMLLELMVTMGLKVELYYRALGDKICIQNHTLDEMRFKIGLSFITYLAAFIIASVQYVQARRTGPGGVIFSNETLDHSVENVVGHQLISASTAADSSHRHIWDMNDLPMTLTAAVYFLRFVLSAVRFLWRDKKCNIQEWYVPLNIDYVIHRHEEFIMLVMGEGILSLLTVDTVETSAYYSVVIGGILTMIFLHVLKMDSDPVDSSKHVLQKSSFLSVCFFILFHALSVSLIGFGVSYKAFLHEIFEAGTMSEEDIEFTATTDYATFPFLSAIIISLELMSWTHKGAIGNLFLLKEGQRKPHWPFVIVYSLKVFIIILCLTLSWKNSKLDEPELVTMVALALVCALLITRVLNRFFNNKAAIAEAEQESKNSTQRAGNAKIDSDQKVGGGASEEEKQKEEQEHLPGNPVAVVKEED